MTDADKLAFADWLTSDRWSSLAPPHRSPAPSSEPGEAEHAFSHIANDGSVPPGYVAFYLDFHVGHAWRFDAAERVIGMLEAAVADDRVPRATLEPAFIWIAHNADRDRPLIRPG
jgi:hypothetical protein